MGMWKVVPAPGKDVSPELLGVMQKILDEVFQKYEEAFRQRMLGLLIEHLKTGEPIESLLEKDKEVPWELEVE